MAADLQPSEPVKLSIPDPFHEARSLGGATQYDWHSRTDQVIAISANQIKHLIIDFDGQQLFTILVGGNILVAGIEVVVSTHNFKI